MISRIHTYVLCCKNRQQAADTKRAHQKRHATTSRDASPIFRTAQFAGENVARDRTRVTRRNLHGKEGVDGSSPSEGLKYLQIASLCCLFRRGAQEIIMEGVIEASICRTFSSSARGNGGSRGNLKGTGGQAESCAAGLLLDV